MTISLTGTSLLVGTEAGLINIYDILSHQLLRTISSHKGMSIVYLKTMLKPVDLIGHVSLSLNVGNTLDAKDFMPVRPVMPFQRMKDAKIRDVHEVTMMLPVQDMVRVSVVLTQVVADRLLQTSFSQDYSEDELLKDYAFFVQPTTTDSSGISLRSRVTELENEVGRLREQLGKAKGVNDVMWETVVHQLVPNGKGEEVEDDSTRRRKRGRV